MLKISNVSSQPDKSLSDQLLQVSIPIVSNRVCKLTYAPFQRIITPRMFCAGDDGMDSCEVKILRSDFSISVYSFT